MQTLPSRSEGTTFEGAKVIYYCLGLGGVALATSWLWFFGLWPYGGFALYLLFPFIGRVVQISYPVALLIPLATSYGVVELIISWGVWRKRKWSRVALMVLAGSWVVYGIFDTAVPQPGMYGNPDFYSANPLVVAYALAGAFLIWYMLRKQTKAYFNV